MEFAHSPLLIAPWLLIACTAAPAPELDERLGPVAEQIVAPDSDLCIELDERARELVEQTMTCEQDTHCEAVSTAELLGTTCAPALSCYLPVSRAMVHADFVAAARDIDQRYQAACGCPIASCVSSDYVRSLCDEGSCTVDAEVPDALGLVD